MSLKRRILDSGAGQSIFATLLASYIRFVHLTTRWTVIGGEFPRRYWDKGDAIIGCFWHGRMCSIRYCWPAHMPIDILISAHRDGRLIAKTMSRLGVGAVIGSKSKGGSAAIVSMRGRLRDGVSIGITPDGPRGPRMRVAPGIIQVAAMTGSPIVPASFSSTRCKLFRSWDRFMLSLPFARGVFVFGEPLRVPKRPDPETVESLRLELEERLNAITAEADRLCGQDRIEPAAAQNSVAISRRTTRAHAVGR